MYFQGVLGYDHTNHSKSLSQYDAKASQKVQWHTCEGERWKTQFLYLESTMLAQWRLITSTVNRLFTRTFWAPRDVPVEGDVSDATPENCFWDGQLSLWSIWRVWTLPRRASHRLGSSDCHCSVSQEQTFGYKFSTEYFLSTMNISQFAFTQWILQSTHLRSFAFPRSAAKASAWNSKRRLNRKVEHY